MPLLICAFFFLYLQIVGASFGLLAIFLLAYFNSKVTFTQCVQLSRFWKQLGTKNEGIPYVTNRLKYICLSACRRYNLCARHGSKTTIKTYNSFRTRQDGVWWSQISRQSTEELLRWKRNMQNQRVKREDVFSSKFATFCVIGPFVLFSYMWSTYREQFTLG